MRVLSGRTPDLCWWPAAGPPPAHLLSQENLPDLAALNLDAAGPCRLGKGVQGPLRRAALIVGRQLPGRVTSQLPRRRRPGQGDDARPLRFGDPPLAPAPGAIAQPVDAGGVAPVQPAAHSVLMEADLSRGSRDVEPVPAQHDDPGPLDPVRRGMPGAREPADLPDLAVIERHARP